MPEEKAIPAAIILYYPVEEELAALLQAINRKGRHLFIAANSPLSDGIEQILSALEHVMLQRFEPNIGQGAALNWAIHAAHSQGFEQIILFDQDSTPSPSMIEKLAEAALLHHKCAAIGPLLITPEGENYRPLRYAWRDKHSGLANFIPTSGSLISLKAWEIIGPFREDYFIDGIDVEWGLRAQSLGFTSLVAQDITMVHRWGTGIQSGENWKPQILRQSRERNYFYLRNAIDILRQPYILWGWKMRSIMTLIMQIIILWMLTPIRSGQRKIIGRALLDGWRGHLGPFPQDL
jgi:rhamnosyltransferase